MVKKVKPSKRIRIIRTPGERKAISDGAAKKGGKKASTKKFRKYLGAD